MLTINRHRTELYKKTSIIIFVPLFAFFTVVTIMYDTTAQAHPKGLLFPIAGGGNFSNDFTSPRSNGLHNATDIFAPKGSKIVAAVSGRLKYVPLVQPSYGYMLSIEDAEGFTYDYIHINNDTPGTDDGNGGPMNAYAPDMKQGYTITRGQFIGYVGDSGNAENTASHLHFEITAPDDSKINPYPYLLEAEKISNPLPYPAVPSEILPYGPSINATVSIAAGKFDTSNAKEIVVGAGPGVSPHIRILKTDGTEVGGFYAYDPSFTGGVDVAAGDIDGDGIDEIITGPTTGAPHVKIFKINGTVIGSFYAYSPSFAGGVSVGAVDVDNDGNDEVLTGAGPGGGPHVRVLEQTGAEVRSFYAYDPSFTGGISVAAGDVTGDTASEIITAPGPGGSAHIRIFSLNGQPLSNGFNAYGSFTGGAKVSVGNIKTNTVKDEILVGPWSHGGPHFRVLGFDGSAISEGLYFDSWWDGSYDVAAGVGETYITTGGNRRSSVRFGPK